MSRDDELRAAERKVDRLDATVMRPFEVRMFWFDEPPSDPHEPDNRGWYVQWTDGTTVTYPVTVRRDAPIRELAEAGAAELRGLLLAEYLDVVALRVTINRSPRESWWYLVSKGQLVTWYSGGCNGGAFDNPHTTE